jgi:hypothetical protein
MKKIVILAGARLKVKLSTILIKPIYIIMFSNLLILPFSLVNPSKNIDIKNDEKTPFCIY